MITLQKCWHTKIFFRDKYSLERYLVVCMSVSAFIISYRSSLEFEWNEKYTTTKTVSVFSISGNLTYGNIIQGVSAKSLNSCNIHTAGELSKWLKRSSIDFPPSFIEFSFSQDWMKEGGRSFSSPTVCYRNVDSSLKHPVDTIQKVIMTLNSPP